MSSRHATSSAALVLLVGLATACSDGSTTDPDPTAPAPSSDASTSPSSGLPGTPGPVDLAVVEREVPLEGTEGSPLTWRLPDGLDAADTSVLRTVRYNVALEALARGAEDPPAVAPWWAAIAAGAELDAQYRYAADDTADREVGPRRAWVQAPEQAGPRAWEVAVCLDVSRVRIGDGGSAATPPASQRVRWIEYTVEVPEASTPKVARVAGVPIAPPFDGDADRAACHAWATDG